AVSISEDGGNASTNITETQLVTDPAVNASGGITIKGDEYDLLSNVLVATFTDPGGPESLSNYGATIDWGDGTPISGAASITYDAANQTFSVYGNHAYQTYGLNQTITITVSHEASVPAVRTSTANIYVGTTALTVNNVNDTGDNSN